METSRVLIYDFSSASNQLQFPHRGDLCWGGAPGFKWTSNLTGGDLAKP